MKTFKHAMRDRVTVKGVEGVGEIVGRCEYGDNYYVEGQSPETRYYCVRHLIDQQHTWRWYPEHEVTEQ